MFKKSSLFLHNTKHTMTLLAERGCQEAVHGIEQLDGNHFLPAPENSTGRYILRHSWQRSALGKNEKATVIFAKKFWLFVKFVNS